MTKSNDINIIGLTVNLFFPLNFNGRTMLDLGKIAPSISKIYEHLSIYLDFEFYEFIN